MAGRTTIGRTLFIYSLAVIAGGLLGFSVAQFAIWGSIIAIKLIVPSTNMQPLLQRFAWPGLVLFVVAGVVSALRMASRVLREFEEGD